MNIHKNARLTPLGRERMVMQVPGGQTPEAAARAGGVCPRTVRKWPARYQAEGIAGLKDRSSRPHRLRQPTPPEAVDAQPSCRLIGVRDTFGRDGNKPVRLRQDSRNHRRSEIAHGHAPASVCPGDAFGPRNAVAGDVVSRGAVQRHSGLRARGDDAGPGLPDLRVTCVDGRQPDHRIRVRVHRQPMRLRRR